MAQEHSHRCQLHFTQPGTLKLSWPRKGAQTFALAILMFAVAAAGTMMIGIMPRTSFLSLPFCELVPCRELLCGGLHMTLGLKLRGALVQAPALR